MSLVLLRPESRGFVTESFDRSLPTPRRGYSSFEEQASPSKCWQYSVFSDTTTLRVISGSGVTSSNPRGVLWFPRKFIVIFVAPVIATAWRRSVLLVISDGLEHLSFSLQVATSAQEFDVLTLKDLIKLFLIFFYISSWRSTLRRTYHFLAVPFKKVHRFMIWYSSLLQYFSQQQRSYLEINFTGSAVKPSKTPDFSRLTDIGLVSWVLRAPSSVITFFRRFIVP